MQRKFAELYFELSNGTRAAIESGYAQDSAHVQASRLLKNDKVKDYIEELQRERRERVLLKMSGMSEKALENLFYLAINAESEQVKLQANKDLLDRTGFKPTDKIENKTDMNGKIEFAFVDPNQE
jgi:phage terminase small subunit